MWKDKRKTKLRLILVLLRVHTGNAWKARLIVFTVLTVINIHPHSRLMVLMILGIDLVLMLLLCWCQLCCLWAKCRGWGCGLVGVWGAGVMPKWYLHSESFQPEINRPASLAITLLIFCNQIHHLYLQANWLHQSRFVPKENRFLLWHVVWISEVSFGHCHLISFMKKETAMISISALWRILLDEKICLQWDDFGVISFKQISWFFWGARIW